MTHYLEVFRRHSLSKYNYFCGELIAFWRLQVGRFRYACKSASTMAGHNQIRGGVNAILYKKGEWGISY